MMSAHMFSSRTARIGCALLLPFILAAAAMAQTGATASVIGTVTDSSSAVVAGVRVTATNAETKFTRTAVSGPEGQYVIFSLPVGRYQVRAEAQGFASSTFEDIQLTIDQRARVDFQLTVGSVSESVVVQGEVSLLKTDDSSTSSVVLQRTIVDLPLNGRNFIQLARLSAAVNTGDANFPNQMIGSVNGQRATNNQFHLDGIQTTDMTVNRIHLTPNVDAIEEFAVVKGIYPAEFGGASGGNMNVAIRSGTNSLHGTLFEFLRNDKVDSRNFFDRAGRPPLLRRNQFGGTFGGPIQKDRTFFFAAYEGVRQRRGATATTRIPTPEELGGRFGATKITDPTDGVPFPNNVIPVSRIHRISRALGQLYPAPTNPQDPARNYVSSSRSVISNDQVIGRIDHRITDRDQIFGRYVYGKVEDAGAATIWPFGRTLRDNSQSAVVGYTHTLTPAMVNETRFGYTRIPFYYASLQPNPEFPVKADIPGVTRDPKFADVPLVAITGYAGLGVTNTTPNYTTEQNFEFVDNLMMQRGRHALKAGVRVLRRYRLQEVPTTKKGSFTFNGNFSGNNLADFLLGLPRQTQLGASSYISTGDLKAFDFAGYFQDDWRVTPRLTLNFGVRYESFGAPVDIRGTAISFNPFTGNFAADPLTTDNPIYHSDRNNFAPRFGFAFRPFADSQTVFRGGYGIYYNANNYDEFFYMQYNPPFGNVLTYQSLATRPTLSLDDPFPAGLGAGTPVAYGIDPEMKMGYVQSFTFNVQRQIARSTVLEVGYVGSKSTRLAKAVNVNYAPPGPGAIQARRVLRTDLANIGVTFPWSNATYHSLQAQLERQFSGGLHFSSGYAWGKVLDDVSGSFADQPGSFTAQDPRCLHSCEKGIPIFNRAHRFTLHVIYELPFGSGKPLVTSGPAAAVLGGWELGSIFITQTGLPLTVAVSGDRLNSGNGNGRADYLGGEIALDSPTLDRYFNTAVFAAPALYTPGNLGRGTFTGPGSYSWDLALYRSISLRDRHTLQFRVEAFNFPNHANWGSPGTTFGTANFGKVTSAGTERQIQFGIKYKF